MIIKKGFVVMQIKKILCLLTVLSVAFCSCFLFTGCKKESDENKKYDVSIKVKNNFDSEWIFEPGVDELYYTFEYTSKEMRFWVDSYNLPKHPRWSNEWFTPDSTALRVVIMKNIVEVDSNIKGCQLDNIAILWYHC